MASNSETHSKSVADSEAEQERADIMVLYTLLADEGDSLSWALPSFHCDAAFAAVQQENDNGTGTGTQGSRKSDDSAATRKRFIAARLKECRERLYAPVNSNPVPGPAPTPTNSKSTTKAQKNHFQHVSNSKPYFKDKGKRDSKAAKDAMKPAGETASTGESSALVSGLFSQDPEPQTALKDISQYQIFQALRN